MRFDPKRFDATQPALTTYVKTGSTSWVNKGRPKAIGKLQIPLKHSSKQRKMGTRANEPDVADYIR
ncbi:hypothetical protein HanXRQr2_Chr01g0031631 [Helianthus annuus]|uniref:Uncharacterized protein n=1 Tax=Helianthus annuus TaxID=4232 RepID=A0A251VRL9_HELAN|nr:hypothetical protein HanXRQr2_Chr01g0031631 [Helianthus annuus]KAJ0957716.1 hypothetical protein HanPSC8_Chr01g0030901 [Helianthus annuus]